ncbi:hypothetical protein RBA69_19180 [Brenneria goodwinii]|uniref:hypothetical protein n=1 Tax=Brenneria goodwinii TaxID=1109412 RepID=UPI0036E4488F
MTYANLTKNQHYLSQIEQRLNSIAGAEHKIYSFTLQDRESCTVTLDNEKGTRIKSNLSFSDLYTFEFLDKGYRKNLEYAFGKYEEKIKTATSSLLEKIKEKNNDILNELKDVLCLKFLNLIRNPYNIRKVLNTFGALADHYPLNEQLLKEYRLLESRDDGGLERVCRDFGVSKKEYLLWMRVIFLSLIDIDNNESMLENLIRALLEDKKHATGCLIYGISETHSDKKPLLSDRAFVDYSDPAKDSLLVAFNLNSNYFIMFTLIDVRFFMEKEVPLGMDKENVLSHFFNQRKEIQIHLIEDNEEAISSLAIYNMNAVYQCHSKVFCSVPFVYKS